MAEILEGPAAHADANTLGHVVWQPTGAKVYGGVAEQRGRGQWCLIGGGQQQCPPEGRGAMGRHASRPNTHAQGAGCVGFAVSDPKHKAVAMRFSKKKMEAHRKPRETI